MTMEEKDNEICVDDKKISYGIFHKKTKIKGKLFPEGKPKASDIRQGYTDLDCYLLATLSSIAHKSPEKITACFVEYYDEHGKEKRNAPDFEKAKDVKIRFFTEDNKKVIIKINKTAIRGKGVPWVRLIEKAILVYRAKGYDRDVDESYRKSKKLKSRLIDGTKGSNLSTVMLAITGRRSQTIAVRSSGGKIPKKFTTYNEKAEELFRNIKSSLDSGKSMVANAKDTSLFKIYRKGLFMRHCYSIIGAHTKIIGGKEYKFIVVRNPYANRVRKYSQDKNGKIHSKVSIPENMYEKGISSLELNDFIKNFEDIECV